MNIYVDFEANGITQPQEIISIGAISEEGEAFYSLVCPHFKLDKKIKEFTNISQEEIEAAPNIEKVMEDFYNWLFAVRKDDLFTPIKFLVYGDSDRDFVKASKALVDDEVTKARLQSLHDRIERVDNQVAKIFRCESISLRSAYLTMRLSSNEPLEQNHNALEDAEMLKYVWENISTYEFPENGEIVKVPRKNMCYGKKVNKSAKKDEKYQVQIKVWINSKKKGYREWIFPNVAAASGMFSCATNTKKRLKVMDEMLAAAENGEIYRNKHIEIVKEG